MSNSPYNALPKKDWLLVFIIVFVITVLFIATNFSNAIRPIHTQEQDIEYLVDTEKQYSLASIMASDNILWQSRIQSQSSLSMANQKYWFKFNLKQLDPEEPKLIEINNALLGSVNIWFVSNKIVLKEYQLGDTWPFSQREIEHENFLIPVPTQQQSIDVYISTYSNGAQRLPINIWKHGTKHKRSRAVRVLCRLAISMPIAICLGLLGG